MRGGEAEAEAGQRTVAALPRFEEHAAGEFDLVLSYTGGRALELAAGLGCRSIAFPAISCGVFGYPLELAVPIAVLAEKALARHVLLGALLAATSEGDAARMAEIPRMYS